MSDQNKAVVRRLMEEAIGRGNLAAVDELVATDFIGHSSSPETDTRGREGYKQFSGMLRGAFPDMEVTIDDQLADGDKVVTRWTVRGTHEGEFAGIPPSGKRGAMSGTNIDRVADGQVAECWSHSDELGLLQQIGAIPATTPAG